MPQNDEDSIEDFAEAPPEESLDTPTGVDDEGEADLPTEYASPQADARLSRANEHEKRPAGAQTPPREGPQAPQRQQRIAFSGRLKAHDCFSAR